MKIVTAEQMREIDRECIRQGTPVNVLMENAGKAVAVETHAVLGDLSRHHVLCLVGSGNNGGDGLVAARFLHEWGARVSVYLASARAAEDENLRLLRQRNIDCLEAEKDTGGEGFNRLLDTTTCVIDGLLGTGRMRPLEGVFRQLLEKVNRARKQRSIITIAIDIPSGMDADTGAVDPACFEADLTVTLAMPKLGLYAFPGAARAGRVIIADIGIPPSLAESIKTELMTDSWARTLLPTRSPEANKGTFGKVLVVAGSPSYIGAASLACRAALRAGAGLVTLATAESLVTAVAAAASEVTYLPLAEVRPGIAAPDAAHTIREQCHRYDVLMVGCGLGRDPATESFVKSLIVDNDLPVSVIDADGLNILADTPDWWRRLAGNAILTPHPGEMSRLSGLSIEEIQSNRLGIAMRLSGEWRKMVVLKGAFTVIASPEGRCRVSPFANAGLASAGTGDVLAGCIAGLLAQGLNTFDAAALGVYLHARAGETVKEMSGDAGMLASDLLPELPTTIKLIKQGDVEE